MNIIVKPYGSDMCYCRPDTTWERENRDFYSPECVNEVLWAPVVFARVSKAGKCIGNKFASRYYDGVGCGMLMYCNVSDRTLSSCVDHTSILPMPLYNPAVLEDTKVFEICKDAEQLATLISNVADTASTDAAVISTERCDWRHLLEDTICNASALTSLRIGDFVAVELSPMTSLATRDSGDIAVKGSFCDNEAFSFKIKF